MPELLSSIDQIDTSWLQSVLVTAGIEAPAISSFEFHPLGAGNTGVTVKVILGYETADTDAPKSVVCKFHPPDKERLERIKAAGVFQIETGAQKLLADHCEAAIPDCYFVAVSDDGGKFNLVCEDLSKQCDLGDQIAGCSIIEAKAAIAELAKMHRQFWNEPGLDDLDWVRLRMPLPPDALELLEHRLRALLTSDQHDIVKRATPRIYQWLELTPENETLIHVDCRVDNMLFDQSNMKSPQAYLIDFALVNVGDAVADVTYFLTSSLTPEDRLACEMDLLALHTSKIAKKDPSWTIEKATHAYRENIVSSLYLTMIAALGMPDNPEANLLLTRLFERNCAAVQHWMNL